MEVAHTLLVSLKRLVSSQFCFDGFHVILIRIIKHSFTFEPEVAAGRIFNISFTDFFFRGLLGPLEELTLSIQEAKR